MRRKNRQFKVTVDIPEEFNSDEEYAEALLETMYKTNWTITVHAEDGTKVGCPVHKVNYADFELEKEEDEDGE